MDDSGKRMLFQRVLSLAAALLIFVLAIYPTKASDVRISVEYQTEFENGEEVCQVLWQKEDEFSEAASISKEIRDNRAVFRLPDKLYQQVQAYRIDFVENPQVVEVSRIRIIKDGVTVLSILPEDFKSYVQEYVGIQSCDITQDAVRLNCVSDDSQIVFNQKFLNVIDHTMKQVDMGRGLAILGILGVYLLLRIPGPVRRRTEAAVSERVAQIRENKKHLIRYGLEVIIVLAVMLSPLPSAEMKIQIHYNQIEEEQTAKIFWREKEAEEFNETDYDSALVENNIARLRLREQLSQEPYIYRMDFVSTPQRVGIEKIEIKKDGICKAVITEDNLTDYIGEYVGIKECDLKGGDIELDCAEETSAIIFNEAFTSLVNEAFTDWQEYRTIALIAVLALILLMETKNPIERRIKKAAYFIYKDFEEDHKRVFWYFSVVLAMLVIVLYWSFLTGDKYYIFQDVGSDSYNQTYPSLINTANRIAEGELGKTWDFTASIGDSAEMIIPKLENWMAFFGSDNVAYLLGISQMLKVFLAGIFFWLYLHTFGNSRGTASIFALGYAFCAHILMRGSWIAYPNETVLFALWLFCFELFYQKKDKRWLPLATALFLLNFSGYYTVLYAGIFCAYAFLRYHSNYRERGIVEKRGGLKFGAGFAGSLFLGYGMASMVIIPNVMTMLKSDRLANSVGNTGDGNFFIKLKILKTAFFRTIGTDIVGINAEYKGYGNILEGPAFYCGLIVIVMIPIIWKVLKGRKRIWYGIGYGCILAYIFINPIKNIANGFTGNYAFKLSSLWVMVLLLMTAADAFEKAKEIQLGRKLYFISLLVAGILSAFFHDMIVNVDYLMISLCFMALYGFLLMAFGKKKLTLGKLRIVLLLAVATEAMWMSYRLVNDRTVVGGVENIGYEDGTQEVVEALKESDDGFYRIDKQYYSASYCDALYQNYYGAVAYKGATGERNLTARFYSDLLLPLSYNKHVSLGFQGDTGINTLMNMKYIISKNGMIQNFGYRYADTIGDKQVYENEYAIPVAVPYDTYMKKDEFEELNLLERRQTFYQAAVLEEDVSENEIEEIEAADLRTANLEEYEISFERTKGENGVTIEFPAISDSEVVVVKTSILAEEINTGKGEDIFNCFYSNNEATGGVTYGLQEGTHEYFFEFNGEDINNIRISTNEKMKVKKVHVYVLPQEEYYKNYVQQTKEWQQEGLQNVVYQDNSITGDIAVDKKKLLVFSVPYDESFKLYVDGEEQDIIVANIGFMAGWIEEGKHQIELRYEPEYPYVNVTIAVSALYVVYFIYYSVRGRKRENEKDISSSSSVQ